MINVQGGSEKQQNECGLMMMHGLSAVFACVRTLWLAEESPARSTTSCQQYTVQTTPPPIV